MNTKVQKSVLLSALYLAIKDREKQERVYMGYTSDSVMLSEMKRVYEEISSGHVTNISLL